MGNGAVVQMDEIEQEGIVQTIKHSKLIIKRGNKTFYYRCDNAVWNYYLGRFYPKADLIMTTEILNHN